MKKTMKTILQITMILAAAAATAITFISWFMYRYAVVKDNSKMFWSKRKKAQPDPEREIIEGVEWFKHQNRKEIYMTSYDGLKLGAYYLPAENNESNKTMLLMHGFRNESLTDFAMMYKYYHEKGFHLLVPCERSHGLSEGEYICFGVKERYDVRSWSRLLVEHFEGKCTIYLHGVSMGAATVMMASGLDLPKQVRGIIADCGYTAPEDIFKHVSKAGFHIPAWPTNEIANLFCKFRADFDFKECSALRTLTRNTLPILFIHGDKDDFVPTAMSRANYDAAIAPKEILIVKGAEHARSSVVAPEAYRNKIMEFIENIETGKYN